MFNLDVRSEEGAGLFNVLAQVSICLERRKYFVSKIKPEIDFFSKPGYAQTLSWLFTYEAFKLVSYFAEKKTFIKLFLFC